MRGILENDCSAHRQYIDSVSIFGALERAIKARKSRIDERVTSLREQLDICRKLNKVFRVGRAPEELVAACKKYTDTVIGPCCLYAYEAGGGIRLDDQVFGDSFFSLNPDEPFVIQAQQEGIISEADAYSAVIVSKTGRMARMHTISPIAFVRLTRWMSEQPDRDQSQRDLDTLQANVVEELIPEYFPQLLISEKEKHDNTGYRL